MLPLVDKPTIQYVVEEAVRAGDRIEAEVERIGVLANRVVAP